MCHLAKADTLPSGIFCRIVGTAFFRGISVDSFYEGQDTKEVHSRLLYAASRKLFAFVVGDLGMGKTTALCLCGKITRR